MYSPDIVTGGSVRLADGDIVCWDMSTGDTFDWKQSLWFGNSNVKLVCAPKDKLVREGISWLINLSKLVQKAGRKTIILNKYCRSLYQIYFHTPVMPWLFMRPILYSAFSDGSRAAPMVMPSIMALNLRTMGFFSRPSGSWGNSLASTGVWLMLDALSEGCGVGVSSLLGGWLLKKHKNNYSWGQDCMTFYFSRNFGF